MDILELFPTKTMVDFFLQRTKKHIELVGNNIMLLKEYGTIELKIPLKALQSRTLHHDSSKYSVKEFIPYIWLTEKYRCMQKGHVLYYPEGIDKLVDAACMHHQSINRHHPEAHNNIFDMSNLDIIEMICDWKAMSQELEEDSVRLWAEKNIGKKWIFNTEQINLIDTLIDLLEKR